MAQVELIRVGGKLYSLSALLRVDLGSGSGSPVTLVLIDGVKVELKGNRAEYFRDLLENQALFRVHSLDDASTVD